jgi:hypothetical protein
MTQHESEKFFGSGLYSMWRFDGSYWMEWDFCHTDAVSADVPTYSQTETRRGSVALLLNGWKFI